MSDARISLRFELSLSIADSIRESALFSDKTSTNAKRDNRADIN